MSQPIKLLVTSRYSSEGHSLGLTVNENPSWEEVEARIRQLDQFCHPLVRLCLTEDEDDDFSLNILGGNGKYAIFSMCADWQFHDPAKSDVEIQVWLSDQGASFCESDVCEDLEQAILIARRFFETGAYEAINEMI